MTTPARLLHSMAMEIRFQSLAAAEVGLQVMGGPDSDNTADFWRKVELFVYSAASVSAMFTPNPRRSRRLKDAFLDRGDSLCTLFEVDPSDFENTAAIRNSIAHIDERYEEFWLDDPSRNLVVRMIGPEDGLVFSGVSHQRFHAYDPDKQELTFRGVAMDVPAVVSVMGLVHQRCDGVLYNLRQRAIAEARAES